MPLVKSLPGCTGKMKHESRSAAKRVLKSMRRRSDWNVRSPELLTVYLCGCGFWHVGHSWANK
jgi:hypothetical protein